MFFIKPQAVLYLVEVTVDIFAHYGNIGCEAGLHPEWVHGTMHTHFLNLNFSKSIMVIIYRLILIMTSADTDTDFFSCPVGHV